MATEKRASEATTPKKRIRKAAVKSEGASGNGTEVVKATLSSSRAAEPVRVSMVVGPTLEEQIRVRAYELYLQRKGQYGSPEQDWFQAAAEINSQHSA